MATLQEIRAKLKEKESRGTDGAHKGADTSIYPFWNLDDGKESVVRFFPDSNPKNTFFWVERAMIKLPFPGIKGETDSKPIVIQVPCVEMYNDGSVCPILSDVRGWFKDKSLEDMGRKYWKKRSFIFQGYVVEDNLKEESKPDNPIRRFVIGPQIFNLIKGVLLDPEMDDLPTDPLHGVDFKIIKTSKGGYADYSTSTWRRRERPLSDAEQDAIAKHGLFDLSSFLPKKPTDVELKIMKEMFEASVDGEMYDLARWGQYFKPYGVTLPASDKAAEPAPVTAPKAVIPETDPWDDDALPVSAKQEVKQEVKPPTTSGGRAEDILALIRNRKNTAA